MDIETFKHFHDVSFTLKIWPQTKVSQQHKYDRVTSYFEMLLADGNTS